MKQLQILEKIAREFNKKNIFWAIGASMMLYFHGLVENPYDIDIIVTLDDIKKAVSILDELGEKLTNDNSSQYSTRYFIEHRIDGIDIDLMAGLRINLGDFVYEYEFNDNSPTQPYNLNGVNIPMTHIEDWYLMYQLMSGRNKKVKLIEDYLRFNKLNNTVILKEALNSNISNSIKNRIISLLKSE
ncbi:MAG: hypothetical protein KAH14_07340 [Clostridiales bacterium]|nr:hypothetical protein [Clostridiales bacterium]